MMKRCKDCCYFNEQMPDCRRHAPRPQTFAEAVIHEYGAVELEGELHSGGGHAWWPLVEEYDWCGEFMDRELNK